ncbi:MAG TPA: hypothetical protein PK771_09060 [Spirochaetota bacterium]|nr:hypothetical protein [Spirochaetota bacterium]
MKKVVLLFLFLMLLNFLFSQQIKKQSQIKVVGLESEMIRIEKELESIQDVAKLKSYFDLILTIDDVKDIKTKEELQKLLQNKDVIFLNTGTKFVFKEDAVIQQIQVIINKYTNEGWEFYLMTETKKDILLTFKR